MALGMVTAGCNDEVFVRHPEVGKPDRPGPEPPDEPEPECADSLMLTAFDYFDGSIEVTDELWEQEGITNFYNHDSEGKMTVLFDNHNSTIVSIINSTYYVTPWATEHQMLIDIPRYDTATGSVTLLDEFMPFKFGITSVRGQLMAGHTESITLPADTKVRAVVYTTRRKITAKAQIAYFNTATPDRTETGWVNVAVWQPVEIRLEWGEITPIEAEK